MIKINYKMIFLAICACVILFCLSRYFLIKGAQVKEAEIKKVRVGDIDIAYKDFGKGYPLVLIMGYGAGMDLWQPFVLKELSRHFRVIIFDNRGMGQSSSSEKAFSIVQFAEDTSGFLDALGIKQAYILGWSMGTNIAQELALGYPEKVSKLILYAADCGGKEAIQPEREVVQAMTDISGGEREREIRVLKTLFPRQWIKTNPDWRKYFPPVKKSPSAENIRRQWQAITQWPGTYTRLSRITQPTLLITGAEDVNTPAGNSLLMAAQIPGAKLAQIDGAGHGLMYQYPKKFIGEVLDFLKVSPGERRKIGGLDVVVLRGSYREMGRQEGALLKNELHQLYRIAIEETYVKEVGMKLEEIMTVSKKIFALYPRRFQDILYGMAETSGLSLEKLAALDQIYVLPKLSGTDVHCSAFAAWGPYTSSGTLVFGRNFDYPEYFKKFNSFLTIIVYNPDGAVPTAVIGYPGGVSAMHGINKEGLFIELNDGTVSAGRQTVDNRITPLLFPVAFLFDSANIFQLDAALNTARCSIAMIFSAADKRTAFAYECSINDTVRRLPDKEGLLVETNHFIAPEWKLGPVEGGEWLSFTRYKNLIAMAEKYKGRINAGLMMKILDTPIAEGGATRSVWAVQQLVVVPQELKVWVKALGFAEWTEIDLKKFF